MKLEDGLEKLILPKVLVNMINIIKLQKLNAAYVEKLKHNAFVEKIVKVLLLQQL